MKKILVACLVLALAAFAVGCTRDDETTMSPSPSPTVSAAPTEAPTSTATVQPSPSESMPLVPSGTAGEDGVVTTDDAGSDASASASASPME